MTATTHSEFKANTEALDVAKAFPDAIKGKNIIVTGVNKGGIGFTTAQAFASQSPEHLIIAGRNPSKIQECIDALKKQYSDVDYRALELDLSSQKSVREGAKDVMSWEDIPSINILVNSAGIMNIPERTMSEDGIELHLATNHIGHFLFTNLIMPKLLKAAESSPQGATRVVNVSSGATEAGGIRWSDLDFQKKSKDLPEEERPPYKMLEAWGTFDAGELAYIPLMGYVQSKAANILFGIGLTSRLYEKHGILSTGVHPGVIMTELGRHASPEAMAAIKERMDRGEFTFKTLGAGASTSLVAATDPKLGVSETKDGKEGYGAYLKDCQISQDAHPRSKSSEEAERLWKLSEELVKEHFSW